MRGMVSFVEIILIVIVPLLSIAKPVDAASCQFVLGFLTLEQLIPDQVGNCLANVQYNGASGDGLQPTTGRAGQGGLLVWRKADNFTAFTDGFRSWVNGPFGLQTRLNSQRLSWEWNPDNLQIVPPPVPGDRCHTAALSLSRQSVDAGAGNFVGTFVFTNNSGVSCAIGGFVGAQLLDAHNNALPTNVVRNGGLFSGLPAPTTFILPAGGSAVFRMHWEDVPVGNETSCPTSASLKIIPPDEFAGIIIPQQINACGGGRLDITAVMQPGGVDGVTSTDTSVNWAGYVAADGTFTGVAGSWTVTPVTSFGELSASATWVGIGGLDSRDLIQAGTENAADASGNTLFDAWIELLPQPPQIVPLTVQPGDSISVAITQQSANQWLIVMTDSTSGQSFQTTVPYVSSLSSAEWIVEAPSTRRFVLPLSNFGTIPFSGGSAILNGQRVTIAQAGAQPITMINGTGNSIAEPTALTPGGNGFSVTRITGVATTLR